MTLEFSRIPKTNLTSVEYLKRHFLNHLVCFFWNRPLIDRWTFCCRCWDLKVFILMKGEFLMTFLVSWRKLTESYSKLLPTNSAMCRLFSCIFYESISIDVSKKVYVISCNLWICSKNAASSRSHYL